MLPLLCWALLPSCVQVKSQAGRQVQVSRFNAPNAALSSFQVFIHGGCVKYYDRSPPSPASLASGGRDWLRLHIQVAPVTWAASFGEDGNPPRLQLFSAPAEGADVSWNTITWEARCTYDLQRASQGQLTSNPFWTNINVNAKYCRALKIQQCPCYE